MSLIYRDGILIIYDRKFAIWPTKCKGDRYVWFKFYYRKMKGYYVPGVIIPFFIRECDNLTEEETIIDKLTENH